jgi:hypothetical protein
MGTSAGGANAIPIVKRTERAIEQQSANMTKPSSRPPCFATAKRETLLRTTASRDKTDSAIETATKATSPLMPGASYCLGDVVRTALMLWSHRRIHGECGRHTIRSALPRASDRSDEYCESVRADDRGVRFET